MRLPDITTSFDCAGEGAQNRGSVRTVGCQSSALLAQTHTLTHTLTRTVAYTSTHTLIHELAQTLGHTLAHSLLLRPLWWLLASLRQLLGSQKATKNIF